MKGISQRFRVISFIPFRQVQRAIDLYMGLGQGKLRAMELNLCLEHLKREWKLVPGNGRDLEKEGRLAVLSVRTSQSAETFPSLNICVRRHSHDCEIQSLHALIKGP